MISDGSVIRFPTENPNSAQAAINSTSLRELMMTSSATAWLTNEIADASRWLSRSITVENNTRPTTAIAVNNATAIAARSRPIKGSRNEIRWTMNPTWANSTSANAIDTVRNATSRKACARIRDADGVSAAGR